MNAELIRVESEFRAAEVAFNCAVEELRAYRIKNPHLLQLRECDGFVVGTAIPDEQLERLEGAVCRTRFTFHNALAHRAVALKAAGLIP